jgi:Bacterial SH3 domain
MHNKPGMSVRLLVLLCCSINIPNSVAETGDALIITGDIVNLRTAPSTDAASPIKLLKDRKVIEIQRQGDWVEIKTNRDDIKTGWVYKSLIIKAKTRESADEKRFRVFKQRFIDLNQGIKKQNGIPYFKDVIDKGNGAIHVIASAVWLAKTQEARGGPLNDVFKLWSDVVPVGSSMSVIVLDEQGEQHMVMLR